MSKIHFRSHFWPFQIDTQLQFFWIFWQNGCRRPFWMSDHIRSIRNFWPCQIDRPFWKSEIHFRWHFWPFQIHTELNFIFLFLTKWPPAAILDENTQRSHHLRPDPIISELLCFVSCKISIMPYDIMLVNLCTNFYSEEDVECAKDILHESTHHIHDITRRMIKRRGDKNKLNDVQDMTL